jgi:hypothetical protein
MTATGGERLVAEQSQAAAVEHALVAGGELAVGDDADHERADEAADEVDADDVERVVVAEAVLEGHREAAAPPATRPIAIAPSGLTAPRRA